jgi:hypothetical protein
LHRPIQHEVSVKKRVMNEVIPQAPASTSAAITDYLRIALDKDLGLTVHVSTIAVVGLVVVMALILAVRHYFLGKRMASFEIEEAEFGLGDQKITLRANDLDRTVAYRIWVELSTRKIGLKINLDDDVIDEIYDSWYEFFSVTRELIKDVPVAKVRNDSTRKIIRLSIEVLNEGLRPHLTRWQARFRRWYAYQLEKDKEAALHPQEIQKQFPAYDELVADMLAINAWLIAYRAKMYELVTR